MPLVRSLAARYAGAASRSRTSSRSGRSGSCSSIERFDTERGVQFTTYAVPTIVGEIQRHFRDRAWALHVPRRMKELSLRLDARHRERSRPTSDARRRSPSSPRRPGSRRTRSSRRSRPRTRTRRARSRSRSATTAAATRRCRTCSAPGRAGYEEVEDGALVEAGLGALDARERRIVELRFFDGLTQSEIAARIGISQMHVSRLLRRALDDDARPPRRDDRRDERAMSAARRHARHAREVGVPDPRAARAGRASPASVPMSERPRRPQARGDRGLRQRGPPRLRGRAAARCACATRSTSDAIEVDRRGRRQAAVARPDCRTTSASDDEPVESGMGLAIIRAVVDELAIDGRRPVAAARIVAHCTQSLLVRLSVSRRAVRRSSAIRLTSSTRSSEVSSKIRRAAVSGRTTRSSPPRLAHTPQEPDDRAERGRVEERDAAQVEDEDDGRGARVGGSARREGGSRRSGAS